MPPFVPSTAPSDSQEEDFPFEKSVSLETVDDDKQSTTSQDIPRAGHTIEALQLVAGNRVRHARCAPEFLEEVAGAHFKKFTSKKFKIITGSEASSFFKNYIVEHKQYASRTDNDNLTNNKAILSPIVFAVTVWEAGSKCVDYYMTWRGKTNPRHCKGKHPVSFILRSRSHLTTDFEGRITRLDSDFRQLAKTLDKEFKRISSLKTHNISTSPRKVEKKTRFNQNHKSHPPPKILLSTPEQVTSKLDDSCQPQPPASAMDSVVSLPLLSMVRGVPFSHRVPLRVTNPDRMSIISEIDVLVMGTTNTSHTLSSTAAAPTPQAVRDSSNTLGVPAAQRAFHKVADEDIKNSSSSIRSTDTRSSRSSVSSRSSSRSDDNQASTEEKEKADYKKDEPLEFVIVFLGDKLNRDPTSWHGLGKQLSIRSLPTDRHSPWISPLAQPDRQSEAMASLESDESGDEGGWRNSHVVPMKPMMEAMGMIPNIEVGWRNSPVVPMKPMLEAMGMIPNTAYFRPAPVIPSIQYHPSIGNTKPPSPHQSPYVYFSPHLDTPYVTWSPFPPAASPLSRSPSQYSAPYASPYLQTHNNPF